MIYSSLSALLPWACLDRLSGLCSPVYHCLYVNILWGKNVDILINFLRISLKRVGCSVEEIEHLSGHIGLDSFKIYDYRLKISHIIYKLLAFIEIFRFDYYHAELSGSIGCRVSAGHC